ncbi:hypothetical protein HHUSO_G4992 [Huso huso]|uniref:Uncharacterized protein n=1 Tax=Huso huso TaxID=61971 RepID=A0ABR1A1J9_HUSHU
MIMHSNKQVCCRAWATVRLSCVFRTCKHTENHRGSSEHYKLKFNLHETVCLKSENYEKSKCTFMENGLLLAFSTSFCPEGILSFCQHCSDL